MWSSALTHLMRQMLNTLKNKASAFKASALKPSSMTAASAKMPKSKLKPLLSKTLLTKPLGVATQLLQPYHIQLQHWVSYDGSQIPVTIVGNPSATPVLLLHAFGMDARQFLPFVLPLAGQYCFYLPHFRGFGLAAATPSSEFNFIEQYADDVDVILTHICSKHQVKSVDVAAISMGALVMWAHFNRHAQHSQTDSAQAEDKLAGKLQGKAKSNFETKAEATFETASKVKRYLNIDQSPIVHNHADWQGGVFGEKQAEVFKQFDTVLQATLPYVNQQSANGQSANGQTTLAFTQLPHQVKRQITQMETAFSLLSAGRVASQLFIKASGYLPDHKLAVYQHPTWQQKLRGLQAYLELPYDYRDALPVTQTPVIMLIGAQSQLYDPKWQRQVANILPNAQVIEIAGSGHAIPLDAPLQFSRVLKQFLVSA
ncbi:alpha/beta hydrolase [Psychrobacter raelei]|uniref:Alpha/beta hydrolase n=1 Tax=Psychrobacter raelei TaxID=2565531 RepID=A0AAT9PFB0_9GAMM